MCGRRLFLVAGRRGVVIIFVLAFVFAFPRPAPAAGPCPPTDDGPRATGDGRVLIAQLLPIGHVENAVGTLVITRADGRVDRLRGRGSLPLWERDECKTDRGSKAFIRLTDGTQLALNEETTFVVRGPTERGRGLARIFRLLVGELWMKTSGPRPIKVETPAATAAIKGTEFNLRVLPNGKSLLTVLQGSVELKNEFCSPCRVSPAMQSVAERGKRCTQAAAVDPAPVIAWIADVIQ